MSKKREDDRGAKYPRAGQGRAVVHKAQSRPAHRGPEKNRRG